MTTTETTMTSSRSIVSDDSSARSNVNDGNNDVVSVKNENEKSLSADNKVDEEVENEKVVELKGNDIDSWESDLKLQQDLIDTMEPNPISLSKLSHTGEAAAAGNFKDDETTEISTMTTTISDKHEEAAAATAEGESEHNKNLSQRLFDIETSSSSSTTSSDEKDNKMEDERATTTNVQEKSSILGWETATTPTTASSETSDDDKDNNDNQMKVLQQIKDFMRAYAARSIVLLLTEAKRRQVLPLTFLPPAQPPRPELHSSASSIAETFFIAPSSTSCEECQQRHDEVTQSSWSHDDEFVDLTMTPKRRLAEVSVECETGWHFHSSSPENPL